MDLDGTLLGSSLAGSFTTFRPNDLQPKINVTADRIRIFIALPKRTKLNKSTIDRKHYYWAKFLAMQVYWSNRNFFRLAKRFFSWQGASKTIAQGFGIGLQIGGPVSIRQNNQVRLARGIKSPIYVDCSSLGHHQCILCLLGLFNINRIYPKINPAYTLQVLPRGGSPSLIFFGQIVVVVLQNSFYLINRILEKWKCNPIIIKSKDYLNQIIVQSNNARTFRRLYLRITKIELMSFENKMAI